MGDRQFWINTWIDPRSAAETGRRLEADGFDGVSLVDNQSVAPDPFVVLGLVAAATERLQLATGTSNPVTRHPAALAAAAATVAAASGDRMLLSIGRGLSANFEIGLPPSPLPAFEQYIRELCGYVRGERVEQHGTASSLKWLRRYGVSGVPVEVTATGPKVIAAAAVLADRLAFAVGTDAARVRWAVETARTARRRAGLDPDGIRYGAYVQTFPHPDVERAIAMARGPVSGLASLSGMAGNDGAGQAPEDREQFRLINEVYDKRRHILTSAPQAQAIAPDFVRRFAAVGSVDEVVERLRTVLDAGVDRLYLSFPGPDSDPEDAAETSRLLREEVLPALRSR
jgi:5,10-methylenetetrahydromethanopterin reductase